MIDQHSNSTPNMSTMTRDTVLVSDSGHDSSASDYAINFTPALWSTSDLHSQRTSVSEVLYDDYYDYICKTVHQHPDIDALKTYLEGEDDPENERTAVHVVDFASSQVNLCPPIIHGVCTSSEDLQTLFDEQDEAVDLRLVLVSHENEIDREILKTIGYELDIDPRVFIEHMGSMFPKRTTYFSTPYLPSEAAKSPIEIHFVGGRSTAVLLSPEDSEVRLTTMLVLVNLPAENLEAALRDFDRPSMHKSHLSSVSLAVPSRMNLTYRYLRRLSEFRPKDISLTCQHPIYLILPLLQLCSLETSMLLTWAEEKLYETRLQHNVYERDPYEAYVTSEGLQQEIFTSTVSLKTHVMRPWLDVSSETANIVRENVQCALQDLDFLKDKAALVQQSVTDALNRAAATESINEARQSVLQSQSVNKLTRLAFVFIPLTFATSLFGMNIREWQADDKVPQLSSFIAVALAMTALTMLVVSISGPISHAVSETWKKTETLRAAFGCSTCLGLYYMTFIFWHSKRANTRLGSCLGLERDTDPCDSDDFEWLRDEGFLFGILWHRIGICVYHHALKKHEAKDAKLVEKMV